ncbi:MAG: PTS sugar transporter subunit IIA [Gemmatimonadota bacterium]
MNLRDFLRTDCVSLGFRAENKDTVFRHIAALTVRHPVCSATETQVYDALCRRERAGSTGFENGIAIPHTRLAGLPDFVVGAVILSDGVDFGAADGQLTRVVVFVIGPEGRPGDHLKLLSAASRVLASKVVREGLVAASDPAAAVALLDHHAPVPQAGPGGEGFSLVTVSVQVEKAFFDILQAVSSETCNISVHNASDASEYLHRLPLYALLWVDDPRPFHRVVVGVVERQSVPGLTAEIAQIADALECDAGVLVVVQDLAYCRGSLNVATG